MSASQDFSAWIGRTQTRTDTLTAAPLRALGALFDWPEAEPQSLPPLGHWLYFLPVARQAELNHDGHPKLGSDLPDFGLPRRMWAGGQLDFLATPKLGAALERRTEITSVTQKQGSSGPLGFVKLRHEIRADGELAVIETQDLVYRAAAAPGAKPPPPAPAAPPPPATAILRPLTADPVMLFRFSAITFNAHRIHYDKPYAQEVEAYPGLVVHGPYQAMLLMDFFTATYPDKTVKAFTFRAQSPLIAGVPALLGLEPDGDTTRAWVRAAEGPVTMSAEFKT